jgi:signal peptidase
MESARKPKKMDYIGTSMNPVLKPGDRLQVNPWDGHDIRRGDVVVFIPPGGDSKIVHRVTSVNSDGIKTRGDNCSHEDGWVLSPEHILGRVVSAQRGNRRLRVLGGLLGHSLAMAMRAVKSVDSILSSLLRPFYKRLAKACVFRRCLPSWMKPRTISLSHPAGMHLQLVVGRRVIGRWLPGMTRWQIKRPFRLFVDEETLPGNPGKVFVVPPEADPSSVANEDL